MPNPTCSDPVAFEDAILSWLHARVTPVAGILFAVALLQLFTFIATCTVVVRRKREAVRKEREAATSTAWSAGNPAYQAPGAVYVAIAAPPNHAPMHGGESRL